MLALAAAAGLGCGAPPPDSTVVEGAVSGLAFENPERRVHEERGAETARLVRRLRAHQRRARGLQPSDSDGLGPLGNPGRFAASGCRRCGSRCPTGRSSAAARSTGSTRAGLGLRPGDRRWARGPGDPATRGTARLDLADDFSTRGAQAAGSFDVAFEGGSFQGTFRARPCGQLEPGCSAAGGGLALFAALPLLLALRRRPLASLSPDPGEGAGPPASVRRGSVLGARRELPSTRAASLAPAATRPTGPVAGPPAIKGLTRGP